MDAPALAALGPKCFISEFATPEMRMEIARSQSLSWYREGIKVIAQDEQAQMLAEVANVCRENREMESKASNGLGLPYYRCPLSVRLRFEDIYGEGCWNDEAFVEDFLKHHPGLRLKVTHGTRGQEYAGCAR